MNILAIIPTYNEAENIPVLMDRLFSVFDKNKIDGSVIIIDDNSQDNTGKVAQDLNKKYPIEVVQRAGKLGLGSAYKEGFKKIKDKNDVILTMDADLSHNPDHIPEFIKRIEQGYDLVIGSRYVPGGGLTNISKSRRIISKCANFLAKIVLNIPIRDCTSAFRCYKRKVLQDMDLSKIKSDSYDFLEEILYACLKKGYKIVEVPIIFKDRERGISKLNSKEIYSFLKTIINLRLKRHFIK